MSKMKLALFAAAALLAASYSAAKADIIVAAAGPMTGEYATFGDQMRHGAEMAVKDINAHGGVLGQKLKLVIGDDACDPKQAVAVANSFVTQHVVFVDGHYCSGSSIPASKVYQEEGILEISPASTNPKYTDEGSPITFRVCGRDDQQGVVAGDWIVKHFPHAKIAVLDDKSAYGQGLADVTLATLQKHHADVVIHESITAGEKDYSPIVSRMKAAGVKVIYLGGYHTEAGLIVRQAKEQGMKATLMSGDALVTKEFWSITGDSGEGTLMTFSPDPRKNPHAAKVVAEFKKENVEPEGYVLYTYAAMQVWAEAAKRAKSTEAAKVGAILHKDKFPTVLGVLSFDKVGDVTAPGYDVYRWSKGNYDYAPGALMTH